MVSQILHLGLAYHILASLPVMLVEDCLATCIVCEADFR